MNGWLKLFRQKYQSTIRAWKPVLNRLRKDISGNEVAFVLGCSILVRGIYEIYRPAGLIALGMLIMSAAVINARMRK